MSDAKFIPDLVPLIDCPPGFFLFDGEVCFKTKYATEVPEGSQQWWPDAYCESTGAYFWGGASSHKERAKLMVRPIDAEAIATIGEAKVMTINEIEAARHQTSRHTWGNADSGPPKMTPEERARTAYAKMEAFGWKISHPGPVPDDGWPIDIIAKAIRDALADN